MFRLSYLQDGGDLPLLEDGHPARRLLLLPPLLPVPLVGHDRQRLVQVRLLRLRQWLLPKRMMLLLLHQEVMLLLLLVVSVVLLLARRPRQRGADGRRRRRRHEGHRLALGVGPHQPEKRFGGRGREIERAWLDEIVASHLSACLITDAAPARAC